MHELSGMPDFVGLGYVESVRKNDPSCNIKINRQYNGEYGTHCGLQLSSFCCVPINEY